MNPSFNVALVIAKACVLVPVMASAATVTVVGATGLSGVAPQSASATADTPGESNTAIATGGKMYQPGDNGGDAAATAASSAASTVSANATATGGGPPEYGGVGSGGKATASAGVVTYGLNSGGTANAVAKAGNGGNYGGMGGTAVADASARTNGAATATAVATAGLSLTSNFQSGSAAEAPDAKASAVAYGAGAGAVYVQASATGGLTNYYIPTLNATGLGGNASLGTVYGQSDTGTVNVSGTLVAGGAASGGAGGVGRDAILENAVAGRTAGRLILSQTAVGGDTHGFRSNTASRAPGGGAATSTLSLFDTSASSLSVTLNATAGSGGSGLSGSAYGVDGADGAVATVGGSIASYGAVSLTGTATGGAGGYSEAYRSGNGGAGVITGLSARSLDNGAVSVSGTQTGGAAGQFSPTSAGTGAGNGADSLMNNLVQGFTTGPLSLTQTAVGGAGALDGSSSGTGHAGRAESVLTQSGTFASLSLTTRATGGNGGYFAQMTPGGSGKARSEGRATGVATSSATATGGTGSGGGYLTSPSGGTGGLADAVTWAYGGLNATAVALATGGAGGNVSPDGTNPTTYTGAGGTASATAYAQSDTGVATARSTATGGAGGLQGQSGGYTFLTASGGKGGDANASADVFGATGADATVTATGGLGGISQGPTAVGGSGGSVVIDHAFASTSSGDVASSAAATGGNGGLAYNNGGAGSGGSADIRNVTARTSNGNATATALAVGGNGSTGTAALSIGGDARVFNAVSGSAPQTLTLRQEARGGNGTFAGAGLSLLTVNDSVASTVNATSISTGGVGTNGGAANSNAVVRSSGQIRMLSQATSSNNGIASAQATGRGAGGSVTATSSLITSKKIGVSITDSIFASSDSVLDTQAVNHFVTSAAKFTSESGSHAVGMNLSNADDLTYLIPKSSTIGRSGGEQLGMFAFSVFTAYGTQATSHVFTGTLSINPSTNPLLAIGLVDVTGRNVQSVTLTATLPSGASTTVSAPNFDQAKAAFTDNLFGLPLTSADTSLTLTATINSTSPTDQFGIDVLVKQTTAAAATSRYYYTGSQNVDLTSVVNGSSNFSRTAAGTLNSALLPSAITDVSFGTTSNVNVANLNTTLGNDLTVNSVAFGGGVNATRSVSISGSKTLTILANAGTYAAGTGIVMSSDSAANTINANVAVANAQRWANDSPNRLAVNGRIGLGANRLTIDGAGLIELVGPIDGTGGLTKSGTGRLTLSGSNTYAGVTVITGGTLAATPSAYSLLLTNVEGLDIRNSGVMVFDYTGGTSPAADVGAALTRGYASRFASGRIRSSTIGSSDRSIGYRDDGSKVTVMITIPGDANLDGTVNFSDFLLLQTSFLTGSRWDQGNFNYDANTNFSDFLILQTHFGQSLFGQTVSVSSGQAAAMKAFASSIDSIPEPAAIGMLGLAATGLLRRRNKCLK